MLCVVLAPALLIPGIIGFVLLRALVLNCIGAFTLPEWGSLEHLWPRDKVELVDGYYEVAGTMADGLMNHYVFRIPDEADRCAFDAHAEQTREFADEVRVPESNYLIRKHREHFRGRRLRRLVIALPEKPGENVRWTLLADLIPGEDGYYYVSTCYSWERKGSPKPAQEQPGGQRE